MQLEIWNLENRQEQGEARQLEAQPKPRGTSTFKWQMEGKSPGRKTENVPSKELKKNHDSFKAVDTKKSRKFQDEGAEQWQMQQKLNKTVRIKCLFHLVSLVRV